MSPVRFLVAPQTKSEIRRNLTLVKGVRFFFIRPFVGKRSASELVQSLWRVHCLFVMLLLLGLIEILYLGMIDAVHGLYALFYLLTEGLRRDNLNVCTMREDFLHEIVCRAKGIFENAALFVARDFALRSV